MLFNKIKILRALHLLEIDKKINLPVSNNIYYSIDNRDVLEVIYKYNIEKIHDKENYCYFNGKKIVDLIGGMIKEELKKDINKTTEMYYRLVDHKKIIEFHTNESFREFFIVEDVLAVIKNKLVQFHPFYNYPISILHMNSMDMINHSQFYNDRIAEYYDHRIFFRKVLLQDYFTFLNNLNKNNDNKYKVFSDKLINDNNEFVLSVNPNKDIFSNILENIFDINEYNSLLMKDDKLYKCTILGEKDYEEIDLDLFSIGTLESMTMRNYESTKETDLFGFYLSDCEYTNKNKLVSGYQLVEILFKIDDRNPNLELSTDFKIYNDALPAIKKDLN